MVEHQFRIAEFVIRVTDQHCVHSACWQARIVFLSDEDVNIVLAPQQRSGPQEDELQLSEINRKNLTLIADRRGEFECEVTGSRAKVDHGVSFSQVQRSKNIQWPLPLIALRLYYVEPTESICKRVQRVESQEDQNGTYQEQC